MTKEKQRILWELLFPVREIGRDRFDYDLFEKLMKARRYAARYHRLCEQACNGEGAFEWMKDQQERTREEEAAQYEKPFRDIEKRLEKLFEDRSRFIRIEFQRDPRGWEIKLHYNEATPTSAMSSDLTQWLYFKF